MRKAYYVTFEDDDEDLILKKLQDICLYEDGWHHTGALYSQTTFYSLDSPYKIASRLIERGII